MNRVRTGTALLVLLMLIAAACGDDDSGAQTTVAPATTAAGEEEVDEPDDDGTDLEDLPGVLSSNDCFAAATALGSAFTGGIAPGGFDADGVAEAFEQLGQIVPSEIEDDVAVMAEALGAFFSSLEEQGVDLGDPASMAAPGVAEAMEEASAALEASEFEEAADNVSAWFDSVCADFAE